MSCSVQEIYSWYFELLQNIWPQPIFKLAKIAPSHRTFLDIQNPHEGTPLCKTCISTPLLPLLKQSLEIGLCTSQKLYSIHSRKWAQSFIYIRPNSFLFPKKSIVQVLLVLRTAI